ncbi:Vacuolar protein sorting-associated protein 52 A [Sesamum angolense]|uniref:Vacuolar protein sorting-associated protein 52 A n=1 Tax=Sesamum angolense TaxID=2727404 RepID=A0AAE2C0M0_9LAMI|nr:Vacuolar protein sorting-associated protein 52 A [Sesamum angolense]
MTEVEANEGPTPVLDLGAFVGELTVEDDAASQDYIKESDNLVSLHDQIHDCDTILAQMEKLLSGFQQNQMAKFVDHHPTKNDRHNSRWVNEEYMRTLEILSKKLKFVETDTMVKTSKALNDVQPELEKLRQKAVSKEDKHTVLKEADMYFTLGVGVPGVLMVYFTPLYVVLFLKEHGKEVYLEVLSTKIRAYIQALEKLQLDIATSSDLIGIDTRSTSLFLRGREPLKNRSAVFALGERINILKCAST